MGIDLAAMQDHLTRLIPDPVIHVRAAAQKSDKWNNGEDARCNDEQYPRQEPRPRALKPLSNDS